MTNPETDSINETIANDEMALTAGQPAAQFSNRLGDNIKHATNAALMSTIIEDSTMTVGAILEALSEERSKPLREMFMSLSIADIVDNSLSKGIDSNGDEPELQTQDPDPEDDGFDEGPQYETRTRSTVPGYRIDDEGAESAGEDGEPDQENSDDNERSPAPRRRSAVVTSNELETELLKQLRANGHRSEEEKATIGKIYTYFGVEKDDLERKKQIKETAARLRVADRIGAAGQARGTGYWVP